MGAAAGTEKMNFGFPTPGPQSPSGQRVMDHVFFLSREEWKKARELDVYDLVIIGTGFCGYAVAKRALERNPACRILILERGPFFLPEHFQNLPIPFVKTLGGLSETFPWTMSQETSSGEKGHITWQHGMVPFFGGRSTLWSAWCPKPTRDEMNGWPEETIDAVHERWEWTESLLRVQAADTIDSGKSDDHNEIIGKRRPVYSELQSIVQKRLDNASDVVPDVYRCEAARLASDQKYADGIDFEKFSIPGELLALVMESEKKELNGEGAALSIATECVVEQIISQGDHATALRTNRGILPLGDASLVLAMGTLPPTTLVRNSFSTIKEVGERFSAHFITAIVARIPRADLDENGEIGPLEIGAFYVAGNNSGDYKQQFHIQLTAISNVDPDTNAERALRYMPDVVATASRQQLASSPDHVVFVFAVLGELEADNNDTWFRENSDDPDVTTNSVLQVSESHIDRSTWDAMDTAAFEIAEKVLSPNGNNRVEYWHGSPEKGEWRIDRPSQDARRVPALVHESSTLYLGESDEAPVDLNYRLRGTSNVFVTGGGLWPRGGSWNPTPTMVAMSAHLADLLVPEKVSPQTQVEIAESK